MTENNDYPKLKLQSLQRLKNIEDHLEREISGILNKKRFATETNKGDQPISSGINEKLSKFLNSRLNNNKDDRYDDQEYDDYDEEDDDYEDEDYYEDDDQQQKEFYHKKNIKEDKDDYRLSDKSSRYSQNQQKKNRDSYLPFSYEELRPEKPKDGYNYSKNDLDNLVLDSITPAIADWLDSNIDRVVQKVVKDFVAKNGVYEDREYSNYDSKTISRQRALPYEEDEYESSNRLNKYETNRSRKRSNYDLPSSYDRDRFDPYAEDLRNKDKKNLGNSYRDRKRSKVIGEPPISNIGAKKQNSKSNGSYEYFAPKRRIFDQKEESYKDYNDDYRSASNRNRRRI